MLPWLLFLLVASLLLGWVYFAWQSWRDTTHMTTEEQEYDEEVASLNDRQANRLSDAQLTRKLSEEDAWAVMVWRGRQRKVGRRRRPVDRPQRKLP